MPQLRKEWCQPALFRAGVGSLIYGSRRKSIGIGAFCSCICPSSVHQRIFVNVNDVTRFSAWLTCDSLSEIAGEYWFKFVIDEPTERSTVAPENEPQVIDDPDSIS